MVRPLLEAGSLEMTIPDKPFHLVVAGDVYIDPVTRDTESWEKEAAANPIWMSRDPREKTGSSGADN